MACDDSDLMPADAQMMQLQQQQQQ